MKSMDEMFEGYLGVDHEGFQIVDFQNKVILPRMGQRCLIQLKGGATIAGGAVPNGFRFFGYRCGANLMYAPLYRAKFSVLAVDRWKAVEGPDFWNGEGRSVEEAMVEIG